MFYTNYLLAFGIISIIYYIVDMYLISNNMISQWKICRSVYSMCILLLINQFFEHWKKKQKSFALEFGMRKFENKEQNRPDYYGSEERDYGNRDYNKIVHSELERKCRSAITWICA